MFIIIINIIIVGVLVFFILRLNSYIGLLEDKIIKQTEVTENLFQSLKEIVAEDYLQNDGRLKKFIYQKERNVIYNGQNLQESNEF